MTQFLSSKQASKISYTQVPRKFNLALAVVASCMLIASFEAAAEDAATCIDKKSGAIRFSNKCKKTETPLILLKSTTNSLAKDVNALKIRTTKLETGQASAKARLQNLETRMSAVEDHLISVDTQINDIKSGAGLIKDRVGVYEDAFVRVRVTGESRTKDVNDNVTLRFGFEIENISGADLYLGRPGTYWSNDEFSVQEDGTGALCEAIAPVGLEYINSPNSAKSDYQKIPAGGSVFASWSNKGSGYCQNLFSGFTYNISFDLARYDTTAKGGFVIGTITFKHQLPTEQ